MNRYFSHLPAMRLACIALLAFGGAHRVAADIVLFSDGRSMKVSSYRTEGSSIELALASGGTLLVPLERVERILDDEVIPVVPEVAKVEPPASVLPTAVFPTRSWKFNEENKPLFKSKYNDVILAAAKKFDVDASLVSAVIKAESDYNPRTVSHKGARGLMQLMPGTALRFGVVDSFDPVANIHAGTRYLRWLLNKFDGNADLAVAAYNAGEGNVWKYKGVPPFRETIQYINRIARHIRKSAKIATVAQ
ncbi:MAG TPA: lytic transglycosylase domain-containing protein [Thermoanaerobaculia bacterium]|nr:lytic transglycosylase domain-containing protein [Thermoanaerobaculia bacterium]